MSNTSITTISFINTGRLFDGHASSMAFVLWAITALLAGFPHQSSAMRVYIPYSRMEPLIQSPTTPSKNKTLNYVINGFKLLPVHLSQHLIVQTSETQISCTILH